MLKSIAILFGLLVAAQPALADDSAKLVGIWKLISWETEFQDGSEHRPVFGKNPTGYLILTAQGRMMAVLEGEGRKVPQTDEERSRAFQTMFAITGIYRVEGDKWIIRVDVAWNPALNGTDQVRFYKLDGDRLQVTTPWAPNVNLGGRVTRGILAWDRVK